MNKVFMRLTTAREDADSVFAFFELEFIGTDSDVVLLFGGLEVSAEVYFCHLFRFLMLVSKA